MNGPMLWPLALPLLLHALGLLLPAGRSRRGKPGRRPLRLAREGRV